MFFFRTAANSRSDPNIILSSILLVAVLCLTVINGLLYYKLWGLEEAAAYTIMDLHVLKYILSIYFTRKDTILSYIHTHTHANTYYGMSSCSFRNTPKTEEDWINLLQQQESLHNVEMRKWQRVLHTAAQLLRQVRLR